MKLAHIKTIDHYAAGSAIVHIDDKLYLIGDNMGFIQVLNRQLDSIDTIHILEADGPMPKATKADIEAATIVQYNGRRALLVISSGSLAPYRNNAWLIDVANKQKQKIDLTPFYARLKPAGIKDLNIEGAATVTNYIILANRGNNTVPENHLIIVNNQLLQDPGNCPVKLIPVTGNTDSSLFNGISGLEYCPKNDQLIATVSTEDTQTSYADGAIGKSYLWFFSGFLSKIDAATLSPDHIIDLEITDQRFKGHKIETACLLSEEQNELALVLAADNDGDSTTLFRVSLSTR